MRGKEANKVHFSSYVRESFVSSREKVKFTFPGELKRKRKEDDIGNRDPPFLPQSLLPFSAGGGGRGRISQIVVGIKKGGSEARRRKGAKGSTLALIFASKKLRGRGESFSFPSTSPFFPRKKGKEGTLTSQAE